MDMVAEVMSKVNEVFEESNLERLARETGFMMRKRKVNPKTFLEKLIFLRLEFPNSSLEDLAYEFYKSDIAISKQGLHKKFNRSAVGFIEKVLEQLQQHAMSEQKKYLEALPFIKNVPVVDSSEIRLNKVLKNLFPQVRNQGSAIKLQAIMNALSSQILSLEVRPSKEPDQNYKKHITHVQEGDLWITDLGYFCVDSFNKIQNKGGFFLSRYFKQTHLYHLNTGKSIDLRALLKSTRKEKVELFLALGESKFPCRLVAIRLPEEAYQQRLKNLREKFRKDPRSKANHYDILNQWTIFVTNLPLSVEADILLKLYRLRWQIELLFKMMKTFLNLRSVDSTNSCRTSISLYASLIAMTLLSFVAATLVDKEISLYKASKAFIKNIREFFNLINSKTCAIGWFKTVLYKFALKESRPKRPSTQLSMGVNYA